MPLPRRSTRRGEDEPSGDWNWITARHVATDNCIISSRAAARMPVQFLRRTNPTSAAADRRMPSPMKIAAPPSWDVVIAGEYDRATTSALRMPHR
jgi:hypothetical protein